MKLKLTNETNTKSYEGGTYGTSGAGDTKYGERPKVGSYFFVMAKEHSSDYMVSQIVTKIIEDTPRRVTFEDKRGNRYRFDVVESINPVEKKPHATA